MTTGASRPSDITDGLPPDRRAWAMAAVVMSVGISSLDGSIVNIALPTIAVDLHVTPAMVIWVINAYQIAMVATLLPLAALGEIVGHERVYIGGLILFLLGAVGAALSDSLPMLITARLFQGLGGSGMMSVNSALIRFIFPRNMLGRGIGLNAMVVGTSITLGPTVASLILSFGPWPWLFAVNIPVGLAAIVIGSRALPPTPRASHAYDFVGAMLAAACLGLLVFALSSAARNASLLLVGSCLACSLVSGFVLIRRQADHPAPMLPVDLFRIPIFALSVGTAMCSFATQGIAFVSLPFLFQNVLGRSTVETGLLMTPWPLVVAVMAPIAGRLSDRYPAGILGGMGLAMLASGMALLSNLPADAHTGDIVWRMMICGCGFGFFQAPNMKALMSNSPATRSGGASGMVATARLSGQTLGAAVAALCFGLSGANGPILALTLGIGFAAVGSVVSFLRLLMGGSDGGGRVSRS